MKTVKQQHLYNVAWSTGEAIIFQSLLLGHQYMLFKVTASTLYSTIGMLFGLVYLAVKMLDLGFNKALFSFYYVYSQTQSSCDAFLMRHAMPSILLYCLSVVMLWGLYFFYPHLIPLTALYDYKVLVSLSVLVLTESIKTHIKRILQLAHYFNYTTYCEVSFIVAYPASIWLYYFFVGSLSPFFIFGSCAMLSLIETVFLSLIFYAWRSRLPHQISTPLHSINDNSTITMRSFAFTQTMSKQVFSSNFLMPLYTYAFGFDSAALFKMASSAIHSINAIIERIIDSTSSALFRHIKHAPSDNKQLFFSLAFSTSFYCIVGGLFLLIANSYTLLSASSATATMLSYIMLYLFIQYSDNIFVMIERFYIAHNRGDFIVVNTLLTNGALILFLWFFPTKPLYAIIFFVAIKLMSLFVLLTYLSSTWGIKRYVSYKHYYIVASIFIIFLLYTAL
jgi:hypothetical protein